MDPETEKRTLAGGGVGGGGGGGVGKALVKACSLFNSMGPR